MLHALGYWRPSLAAFPEPPVELNNQKIAALRAAQGPAADKMLAEYRQQQQDYNRDYATFDDEAMTAVDKFRADKGLNYQGTPVGLVDARFVDALRAAYFAKRKTTAK
jgi:hypothetical protein